MQESTYSFLSVCKSIIDFLLKFFRTSNGWKRSSSGSNSSNDNHFYGYRLLCDDFLMAMAIHELDKKFTLSMITFYINLIRYKINNFFLKFLDNRRIRTFDLSYSGLTINGAIQQLKKISNTKIILNVGSEDILNGRQLIDIKEDFHVLIRTCSERNIQVILTTLAPLANLRHDGNVVRKWEHFNRFLMSFSLSHKVIDIVPCMITKNGKIEFNCYKT